MALENQKRWIIFVARRTRNIQISPVTKITKLMSASYLFSFSSACWERNEIS